jgi:hypothetical protein
MAAPTIFPNARSFFGIAKEVTSGTAVAPARFPPLMKFDPIDTANILIDEGLRGSMAKEYNGVVGKKISEASFEGPVFDDSIGDFCYNTLGDYSVTGTGPYTHVFGLLNSGTGQPPSHTLTDYQGITATVGARAYPFSVVEEITFTGNAEKLFMVSGKTKSLVSAAAATAPTNTPTTEVVLPSWLSTVTLAGAQLMNITEWAVTLKREIITPQAADGTQNPYTLGRGALTVEGKLTFVAADESPLTAYLAGTIQSLVLNVDNGLTLTAHRDLSIQMTKVIYKKHSLKRNALLGWETEFTALANATDATTSGGLSPCKATLINALTTF